MSSAGKEGETPAPGREPAMEGHLPACPKFLGVCGDADFLEGARLARFGGKVGVWADRPPPGICRGG